MEKASNLLKWRRERDSNPRRRYSPLTRLAGERLQPARPSLRVCRRDSVSYVAEGVGFEPTELSLNGFQDRRLKPLGHPSENVVKPIKTGLQGIMDRLESQKI
jgi:hypothetical protein